jgi:hypothetical protein
MLYEYGISGKWPELLKEIAPGVKRVGYLKYKVAAPDHGSTIALVLFLCPSTGDRVQRWFTDNGSEDGGEMQKVSAAE